MVKVTICLQSPPPILIPKFKWIICVNKIQTFLHLLKAFAQHCVLDTFPSVKNTAQSEPLITSLYNEFPVSPRLQHTATYCQTTHLFVFSKVSLSSRRHMLFSLYITRHIYVFIYNIEIERKSIHFCWTGLKNISKGQCKPWSIYNTRKRPERRFLDSATVNRFA